MKKSNIIIFIIIIVFGICITKIILSKKETVWEHFNNQVGYISDYHQLEEQVNKEKREEQTNIAIVGGIIILLSFALMKIFKAKEDRIDPLKNLINLKESSIITQDEFNKKLVELKLIEKKNIDDDKKEKEIKKLTENLQNIKAKGIISEKEFNEKLELIKKDKLS